MAGWSWKRRKRCWKPKWKASAGGSDYTERFSRPGIKLPPVRNRGCRLGVALLIFFFFSLDFPRLPRVWSWSATSLFVSLSTSSSPLSLSSLLCLSPLSLSLSLSSSLSLHLSLPKADARVIADQPRRHRQVSGVNDGYEASRPRSYINMMRANTAIYIYLHIIYTRTPPIMSDTQNRRSVRTRE